MVCVFVQTPYYAYDVWRVHTWEVGIHKHNEKIIDDDRTVKCIKSIPNQYPFTHLSQNVTHNKKTSLDLLVLT